MDKNLVPQVFNHEEFGEFRVFKIDEVPWAVAADVAKILGIEKVRNTLANFPDDEKKMFDILTTAHSTGGRSVKQAAFRTALFLTMKKACVIISLPKNFTDLAFPYSIMEIIAESV